MYDERFLSQFWYNGSLTNHFQEVVVYRICLPKNDPSSRDTYSCRLGFFLTDCRKEAKSKWLTCPLLLTTLPFRGHIIGNWVKRGSEKGGHFTVTFQFLKSHSDAPFGPPLGGRWSSETHETVPNGASDKRSVCLSMLSRLRISLPANPHASSQRVSDQACYTRSAFAISGRRISHRGSRIPIYKYIEPRVKPQQAHNAFSGNTCMQDFKVPGSGRDCETGLFENRPHHHPQGLHLTPNLPTNIVGFRGFDSSIFLNSRGGIPRPIGNLLESLSQAMLVGVMSVGRLAYRKACSRWEAKLDGFPTGSGQTGSSQKCRNSP